MKNKKNKKFDFRFEIANLITEVRYHYGITQAQLAKKMKTKQPSIARVESGNLLPSLSFIEKLAEAVGTYVIAPKFGFMEDIEIEQKNLASNSEKLIVGYYQVENAHAINQEKITVKTQVN